MATSSTFRIRYGGGVGAVLELSITMKDGRASGWYLGMWFFTMNF
jgi:hypothetical protein